jgi:hypothetical protein
MSQPVDLEIDQRLQTVVESLRAIRVFADEMNGHPDTEHPARAVQQMANDNIRSIMACMRKLGNTEVDMMFAGEVD